MDTPPLHPSPSPSAPPPPPIAQLPKRRIPWVLVILVAGVLSFVGFVVLIAALFGLGGGDAGGSPWGGDKVIVIHVSGMIVSGSGGGSLLGGRVTGSRDVVKQLSRAQKDDKAKAVVLQINSPGGSAAASQEIFEALQELRQAGKPVYASMADVAASGGYYVAAASDRIYAQAATLTGSIGVIMHMANLTELYRKIGYEPVTLKAGKHKDLGSPDRPMTPEERQMMQALLDDVHNQFIEDVAKGRKWSADKVKALADGRIYTGRQAREVGLVDEIGSFSTAVKAVARAAGIEGDPALVSYERRSFLEQLMESAASSFGAAVANAFAERLEPDLSQELLRQPKL